MDDPQLHELLRGLASESRNPRTVDLDRLDSQGVLERIHREDRSVLDQVEQALPAWAKVVDEGVRCLRAGGRLFYAGAGTSGRLGVLDAAECPPTFSTDPDRVVGLLAGGRETLVRSQEGVEDRPEDGARDVEEHTLGEQDLLVAISASRRTPYAIGALRRARERGAATAFLVCNAVDDATRGLADHVIEVVTGPEAVTGSTRMKAALAQKMMLTMLTTAIMVRCGKVYGNLMVDVAPTSQKLRERAKGLVMDVADVDYARASALLRESEDDVKVAIVMARRAVDVTVARELLEKNAGILAEVIGAAPGPGGEER